MGEPYRRKLKGHVLVSVGSRYGFPFKGIDRSTKARCECGAESPAGVKTIAERREWHNRHKGQVREQELDPRDGFNVLIRIHSDDAPKTLSDPGAVRLLIGEAFDSHGIEEEIDYTLEVTRCSTFKRT